MILVVIKKVKMRNLFIVFVFLVQSCVVFGQIGNTLEESFMPVPGKEYVISAWVKDEVSSQESSYNSSISIILGFLTADDVEHNFSTTGSIIDGWQIIQGRFFIPEDINRFEIKLIPGGDSNVAYFDDIRFFPDNGNLKSFVYDPINQRLLAELDENNYATFYEYDREGGLVRVKKETERGIKTIQETRSSSSKANN